MKIITKYRFAICVKKDSFKIYVSHDVEEKITRKHINRLVPAICAKLWGSLFASKRRDLLNLLGLEKLFIIKIYHDNN